MGRRRLLDTLHAVETPEGVCLELRAAGPVARAIAWAIDATLRWGLYMVLSLALIPLLGLAAFPLLVLLVFLGEWFYPVFFEVGWHGQTIGKRAVGLRVVNDDGTPVTWSSSMLRNLLLAADMVPGTFLAGLVCSLATEGNRRLGDLAAGTLVIHAEGVRVAGDTAPETPPVEPPVALTLEEQRALVAFAERASLLSDARASELAAIATPLHRQGVVARERLLGIAAWLLGRGDEAQP
jgi:uncharacterized RDD family membrane protein YckC